MTLSELRQEVRRNLGRNETTDTELNTMIDNAINYILTKDLPAEGLRPFRTYTDVTTTADAETVSLSTLTGFVEVAEDGVKIKDGDDYYDLSPMSLSVQGDMDTGQPLYYEIIFVSGVPYMSFRPIPDDEYTIRIYYYASETELTNDSDEANLSKVYGDMPIIAGATWYVARQLAIPDLLKLWEKEYEKEKSKLFRWQYKLKEGDIVADYNLYL